MNLPGKIISPASDYRTRCEEAGETGLAALPLRCAERLCLSGPAQTNTCWQGCALPASVSEGSVSERRSLSAQRSGRAANPPRYPGTQIEPPPGDLDSPAAK